MGIRPDDGESTLRASALRFGAAPSGFLFFGGHGIQSCGAELTPGGRQRGARRITEGGPLRRAERWRRTSEYFPGFLAVLGFGGVSP